MRPMFSTAAIIVGISLVMPLQTVVGSPNSGVSVSEATRLVRLGLHDGTSRLVRLEGVGCDETMCSRIAVNTRTVGNVIVNRTRFEDIRAIEDVGGDAATFVFKDGTTRRVSVIADNRVLYVIDDHGRSQKIRLSRVRSVDFRPDGAR